MTRQPYRLRKYWSTVLRPIGLERTLWEEIFFKGYLRGPVFRGLCILLRILYHGARIVFGHGVGVFRGIGG